MNLEPAGHRAPALWLLLPLMAGLTAGRALGPAAEPAWLLAGAALALLAGAAHRHTWAPGLVLGVCLTGAGLYALERGRLPAWDSLPPREARLTVQVTRLFGAPADGRRTNGLGRITAAEPHLAELVGQRLSFSLTPARTGPPDRGEEVAVIGVLQPLTGGAAHGTFDDYLDDAGINFRLSRGRILDTVRPPGAYRRFCTAAQDRFETILSHGLQDKPALGGIYRAMLLGRKSELSEHQGEIFKRSGTLHLFAISGLHIATLAVSLQVLLTLLRLPRVARFLIGTLALWLYTDITGGTPSAVRAFFMATMLSALPVLRMPGNALAALAVSAVVVLLADPLQLFSASFQMSYGIVTALIVLGLPLMASWHRRYALFSALPPAAWTKWHHGLDAAWRKALTVTALGLAATLISTVSSVAFFNLVTPGAFFANLVLIPLAATIVFAGCASLLCGLAGLPGLSVLFNHAAALVLALIERCVGALVELPGSHFAASFRETWLGSAALVLLIVVLLHGYARQWREAAGGFWPPFATLALILAFTVTYG